MKDANKEKNKKGAVRSLTNEIKGHKITFAVYAVLRLIVIAFAVLAATRGQWENLFTCLLTLVLLLIPSFVERSFKVKLPSVLEVIVLLFVFAAQILGEIQCYYIKYPMWDTMLHTVNGFIFAAAGFALVDVLNRNDKIKLQLNPMYMALVAFCFSMTVGVMWEFFEYGADCILHTDMQKDTVVNAIYTVKLDPTDSNTVIAVEGIKTASVNGQELGLGGYLDLGIHDTMKDLLVNFIGAVVFSIIGFVYVKNRGKKKSIAALFIPTLKDEEREPDGSDTPSDEEGQE
ncbi:MAG: hypothetical protein IJ386_07445 [Clostridia bacterium]|nr:hypothetical protein [Clostridia bacterium]